MEHSFEHSNLVENVIDQCDQIRDKSEQWAVWCIAGSGYHDNLSEEHFLINFGLMNSLTSCHLHNVLYCYVSLC